MPLNVFHMHKQLAFTHEYFSMTISKILCVLNSSATLLKLSSQTTSSNKKEKRVKKKSEGEGGSGEIISYNFVPLLSGRSESVR